MLNINFNIVQIGCGYWGTNLAKTFNRLGSLSHLCDENIKLAKKLAIEINPNLEIIDPKALESLDEVDAASIATPANTHFEIARTCLKKGWHVYIEKPITLVASEAEELINCAKESNLKIQAGHLLLYHPAVERMHELIANNKIGDIRYIYSNRISYGKIRTFENVAWSFMPHDISLILYFAQSELNSMDFKASSVFSPNNLDTAHLWLNFSNGIRSHIFASWCNPFKEHKLVIIGQTGSLIFEDSVEKNKLTYIDYKIDLDEHDMPLLSDLSIRENLNIKSERPLDNACKDFIDSCKSDKEPLASVENALEVVRILENTN